MTKAEVYKDIFVILITLTFILSVIKLVYSQPYVPHQFYGDVKCPDGTDTPDGTKVSVKLQSIEIKSTGSSAGKYGYSPLFLVWETTQGSNLDFYVSDIYYTTVQFSQGASQKLDFTLSSCPTGGSSSGGGGSSGGVSTGGSSGGGSTGAGATNPIKSIIFDENSPINPSNPILNPNDLKAPALSNYIPKITNPSREILALDVSIVALLILSVMVLVVYTKTRSKSGYLSHKI